MTTYELADLAQSSFANTTSAFTVFLSVVFAYIVTAHLVGARLTRTQNRILTSLFLLVSIFKIWAVSAYVNGGVRLNQLAYPDAIANLFAPGSWLDPLMGIVGLLVIVMALKIMWDVRPTTVSNPS